MRFSCKTLFYSAGAIAIIALSISAKADTLTLLGTSSAAYAGYPASDAIDIGADQLVTDFASNGGGTSTHLDFAISGPANHINLYDRTTSGGGNNAYTGGTTDFTTEFELIFSDNSDFSSPLATYDFTKSTPASPSGPSSFLFSADFASVNATYVRYQVIQANGVNPGLADISIIGPGTTSQSTIPEPGGLALLGTGMLGLVGMLRRRMSGK